MRAWTPTTHRGRKDHYRADRDRRDAQEKAIMAAGPQLHGDTLVIPSVWYNPDAAALWSAQGFRYSPALRGWLRDLRKPAGDGKMYEPEAWLKAAQRRFYELYPEAATHCQGCGQQFIPVSAWQTLCSECQDPAGNWR